MKKMGFNHGDFFFLNVNETNFSIKNERKNILVRV